MWWALVTAAGTHPSLSSTTKSTYSVTSAGVINTPDTSVLGSTRLLTPRHQLLRPGAHPRGRQLPNHMRECHNLATHAPRQLPTLQFRQISLLPSAMAPAVIALATVVGAAEDFHLLPLTQMASYTSFPVAGVHLYLMYS
ncbi:hypothetical protein M758_UG200000 [Ceratodon purpureus]|nr:hypothetical protein M758_UG200000 [Ceratodon purpureus]